MVQKQQGALGNAERGVLTEANFAPGKGDRFIFSSKKRGRFIFRPVGLAMAAAKTECNT